MNPMCSYLREYPFKKILQIICMNRPSYITSIQPKIKRIRNSLILNWQEILRMKPSGGFYNLGFQSYQIGYLAFEGFLFLFHIFGNDSFLSFNDEIPGQWSPFTLIGIIFASYSLCFIHVPKVKKNIYSISLGVSVVSDEISEKNAENWVRLETSYSIYMH